MMGHSAATKAAAQSPAGDHVGHRRWGKLEPGASRPPMPRALAVLMAKKLAEPDHIMTAFLFMLLRETFLFQRGAIEISPLGMGCRDRPGA